MATTATVGMTFRSVLGSVTSAATSVGSLFDTAYEGIQMANKFVKDASEKQNIDSEIDLASYQDNQFQKAVQEQAKTDREVQNWFDSEPGNKELYESAAKRLETAIAARRDSKRAQR